MSKAMSGGRWMSAAPRVLRTLTQWYGGRADVLAR